MDFQKIPKVLTPKVFEPHCTSGRASTIARFDESTRTWSKLGEVLTPRSSHGVIYTGQAFLVIGGRKREGYKLQTEQCDIKNDVLSCRYLPLTLKNFYFWPATVLIDDSSYF